jgi:hypothetical protein
MALSAPSNLQLDIGVAPTGITQANQELAELQKRLADVEKQYSATQSRVKERAQGVRELSYETKQLVTQRQQLLAQIKRSDSPTEIQDLKRQAAATQDLILTNKKHIETQRERLDISKQNNIAQKAEMSTINAQISATNKHMTAISNQQKAYLKANESQNIFTMSMDKFNSVLSRVIDYMVIYGGIMIGAKVVSLFTVHMIEVNEQFEKLQVRLYTLNPNLEQTAKIWEEIKNVTITSPFRITEVGQAAVMLRTFGVSAVENLRTVSDWAAATEKNLDDIAVAFGKIVNRSPRTALMLSTRGLSEGGYEKYIDEYRDRATALRKYIEDTFGGTSARISETFYGLKTNIADLFDIMEQRGGKPIFEQLKSDLNYIQAILKDINKGSSGTTAGFFAKLVPDSVLRLLAGSNLYGEQQNLQYELNDPNKNAKERLAITERLVTINKLLNGDQSILVKLWDGLWQTAHGHFSDMKELKDVYEEQRKILEGQLPARREAVKLANEELLKRNSNFSMTSAYELQKSMEKAPELMTFLKSILVTGGGVISESASYMMTSLTNTVTKKQALSKIEADITATVNRRPKADEDIVRFGLEREADLKELIAEWLKLNLEKRIKELKDLLSVVKELGSVLAGQKAQLGDLLGGSTNLDARIAKNTAYLTAEKVNLQDRMAYIDSAITAQEQLSKLTNEQLNSKTNQQKVKDLQHQVEVGKIIIQLTQDEVTLEDKLIASQKTYNQLMEQNYLTHQQIDRDYTKKLYGQGILSASDYRGYLGTDLSGLQSESDVWMMKKLKDQAVLLTMGQDTAEQQLAYSEQQTKIAKDDAEILKIEKQLLAVREEALTLPSQSFGDALNKQLLLAKKSLDSIHDTLVTIMLDMGREFGKGLITEALFGTRSKDLTSQIDDLRFQLLQMDIEKNNTLDTATKVKLVEDQEVSLLARINDLERQRSQIILTLLSDAAKKMLDKLEDQAINALFTLAGGLFSSSSTPYSPGYYDTNMPRWYGNKSTSAPLLPPSSQSSRSVILQLNGNIYGGREFKEQVQTAMVEINRNIK